MWNPDKIEIYNLFSHKESVYSFKNNVCTVIFGRNESDRGQDNNGAGKSTLLEAIYIALTNDSLRKLNKEAFINRDEESCKIVFHLHNDVLKSRLKVSRQFFRGSKPVKVEVWEDDELNKQITSSDAATKRVLELIGVSKEDLSRYFIISQDNKYQFFTSGDLEKKEVMNRITSADMINPVIEELSIRKKEKQAVYDNINAEIGELTVRRGLIEEQRQDILNNDTTEEEVNSLKSKISSLKERRVEIESDLKKVVCSLKCKDDQIAAITVFDTVFLKKDKKRIVNEIDIIETEIEENNKISKKLKAELEDVVTCPNCHKDFINESELELEIRDVEILLEESKSNQKSLSKKIAVKQKKLESIKKKLKEAERAEELINDINEEKENLSRKEKRFNEDLLDIDRKNEKFKKEIEALKNKKKDNKLLNSLMVRIEECDKSVEIKTKEAEKANEELEMILYWIYYMGKSGFQTYLANKSIKTIEGITNSFLRKFKVDLSVLINGFSILKSGEVREKIDVFALSDGINAEPFLSKSGGERGRINLAGVLGIQHLINMSTNGRGINLLALDECFAGVDTKGQENIIKILEKTGITVMMITQNVSDSFNNENKLYVVKKGDVSRYV